MSQVKSHLTIENVRSLPLLGMDHLRWCRGVAGGNPGNPENPESQDTCINMPISTHSSVTNLLHSSAYRSTPTQTPTTLAVSFVLNIHTLTYICGISIKYLVRPSSNCCLNCPKGRKQGSTLYALLSYENWMAYYVNRDPVRHHASSSINITNPSGNELSIEG